ncbi:unnamed protein product [Meloidogyne enterolobii]|uniref:Uncharacterized protein n=1 Tax=Meloidogyne enterolobii TaxID=390850 RepID=A0ACB0YZS1_MELEN
MFLTSLTPYVNTNIVVCELEQNDKLEKGLYYFQLSKYPKNIEEMKIARYFFQLLFNCSFTFFEIHLAIINSQMIELLFDDVKVPLQIHTQETDLMFYDDHPLNIVRNHLVANEFNIEFGKRFDFDVEKKADVVLEILANGGDKFSSIYLEYLHSKLYNLIIEHIVASQDITKMVKKIHFEGMYGPLISSENAINAKIEVIDNIKITKFQLVNKYNPKIVFSVSAKHYNKIHAPGQENCETGVDAKIRRIN